MFHQRDGLFFDRKADGAVRIVKTSDGREPGDANVILDQTIPVNEFASVVADMSADGEADGGFYRALDFLTLRHLGSAKRHLVRWPKSGWAAYGHETGMGRAIATAEHVGDATSGIGNAMGGHAVGCDLVEVEVVYRERRAEKITADDLDD